MDYKPSRKIIITLGNENILLKSTIYKTLHDIEWEYIQQLCLDNLDSIPKDPYFGTYMHQDIDVEIRMR